MTPVSSETVNAIKYFIDDTKQFDGQKAEFKILSSSEVSGGKAPHYVLAFCQKSDAAYINVGYVLQKADLFIQSLGMGSVWLGMADPKDKNERKDFCIMLGFGNTSVPARNSGEGFKRLDLCEISPVDNEVARAARLAPSAMNSQPWKLTFLDNAVIADYCGRGLLKGILRHKFSNIDIGIITRHIELALLYQGKKIISITPALYNNGFKTIIEFAD